ncbi:MAG: hypothetical protein EZS28_040748 [Streblomastix strix]|uniref:Ubiquitin-like domain-containing protein n=1 Tax=Streblomastix strix TaxID=222440 RepID=A0A5J4U271_9EUKA|nr:MAG: hypothetical protein EZS28_040748 [Streblomastix strix]
MSTSGNKISVITPSGKVLSYDVGEKDTIKNVKEKVQASEQINIGLQSILLAGHELKDDELLQNHKSKAKLQLVVKDNKPK